MDDDEASTIPCIDHLQDLQERTAGNIEQSSLTRYQTVSSFTNHTLDVIGNNQARLAKYTKGLAYLQSIVMSDVPIKEAFAEDKIRDVFSGFSTNKHEKRRESYFR